MPAKSHKNHTAGQGAYRFGEFDLYPAERQLHRGQRTMKVSPKVFDALLLFVRNPERLVRRDTLIETLWPDTYVTDANLTNVILSLRKTLGRRAIQTVSKFGYRFCLPVIGEPGVDQVVYATFVKAKELARIRSLESMTRARDLFVLCVATDPQFAAGWAWLGRRATRRGQEKSASSRGPRGCSLGSDPTGNSASYECVRFCEFTGDSGQYQKWLLGSPLEP